MKHIALLGVFLCIILISCEKEMNPTNSNEGETLTISKEKISGYVQKGPYLNGSSVTIYELSTDLVPTGKNFNAQIVDNKGTFALNDVPLSSQYVELRADGFYFNEVTNNNSSAQLTLMAISDLNNKNDINVNVLSHLEKSRVEYLLTQGIPFTDAKKQAQSEILSIFLIDKTDMMDSEELDISKAGEDHAILLAISVILQGYLPVADLSELLANISTDVREDGVLDSQSLGSILINNAKTINVDDIRENLNARFDTLGLDAEVPDFEKYVTYFIENSDFSYTGGIKYPAEGKHGLNILDKDKTEYTSGTYSMKAVLPEGTDLQVKITGEFHWYFPAFQTNTGWDYSTWNDTENSRVFTSTRTDELDFEMMLESFEDDSLTEYTNKIYIEVYENGSTESTWTKEISID